MLAIRWPAVK